MLKKIRVENNQVVECMSPHEVPIGAMDKGDWRDAIEVPPQLIPNRQICGSHWFDLTKNPVEIRWNVEDISIEDRKKSLYSTIDEKYKKTLSQVLNNMNDSTEVIQIFLQNMMNKENEKNMIKSFNTHEQVDDYINNQEK